MAAALRPISSTTAAEGGPAAESAPQPHLCVTCGVQFAVQDRPPAQCPICEDERQYVGANGQQWTTLATLHRDGWKNVFREQEPNLVAIGTEPKFAIG